jgi:hypothetical protein
MTVHIFHEQARFVELRRRLLNAFPDLDEQTLADTLEGATNLHEALAALIRSTQEDECLAKALKERADGLGLRLNRIETRAAHKRQIACETMEIAGIRKLAQPDFTASLRAGPPSVDIVNDTLLPPAFLTPQPPKPDKRGILTALTAGAPVPGAALCLPKLTLSIRSA